MSEENVTNEAGNAGENKRPIAAFLEAFEASFFDTAAGYCVAIVNGDKLETLTGGEAGINPDRMALKALIRLLEATPKDRPLVIGNLQNVLVAKPFRGRWLKGWVDRNFRTVEDAPIKDSDLWREIVRLVDGRVVAFEFSEAHAGIDLEPRPVEVAREQARLALARVEAADPRFARFDNSQRLEVRPEGDVRLMKLTRRETLPKPVRAAAPLPEPGVIHVFTSGRSRGTFRQKAPGGWAALLVDGESRRTLKGSVEETTSERIQLVAAVEALTATPAGANVAVFAESEAIAKGVPLWVPGWKKRKWTKANGQRVGDRDLWQALDALAAERTVTWHYAYGDKGYAENDQAVAGATEECGRTVKETGWDPLERWSFPAKNEMIQVD